jgi:hypothetical protein
MVLWIKKMLMTNHGLSVSALVIRKMVTEDQDKDDRGSLQVGSARNRWSNVGCNDDQEEMDGRHQEIQTQHLVVNNQNAPLPLNEYHE